MSIVVATYNVLAAAYVRPEYYPRIDAAMFLTERRYPLIVERVLGLNADVVCLQEVDIALFRLLETALRPLHYTGKWAHKDGGKPDGCATFVRRPWHLYPDSVALSYQDGRGARGPSGHVALITVVECDNRPVTIVNTHLKWSPPDAAPDDRMTLIQATELLEQLSTYPQDRIVCGDFNVTPERATLSVFRANGLADAHAASVMTCNPNGAAVKIDYLLHSPGFFASPVPPTLVEDDTLLPSSTEPSDHIPLVASFSRP